MTKVFGLWTFSSFDSKILHNDYEAMITVYCIKVMCSDRKPWEPITHHQISLATLNLPIYHWWQMYFNHDHGQNSLRQLDTIYCVCCSILCILHPCLQPTAIWHLQLLFQGQAELNLCEKPSLHHTLVSCLYAVYSNDPECQRPETILLLIGNMEPSFLLFRHPF